jgi:transcriptional regulator of acetoin/glycerol metabolism
VLLARDKELNRQHFTGLWDTAHADRAVRPNTIDALEQDAIRCAFNQCKGNVAKTAKLLGLSPATLYRRLKSMKSTHD